eukprot:7396947-Pyramimonas_sp.AAC.1
MRGSSPASDCSAWAKAEPVSTRTCRPLGKAGRVAELNDCWIGTGVGTQPYSELCGRGRKLSVLLE